MKDGGRPSTKSRKNPFPMRQNAIFTNRTKNPRFILSYGINLEGPTLKNLDMPKHAENTDNENVTSVCHETSDLDEVSHGLSESGPRKTITIIRCTCGNDSRNGSENKELCEFLKGLELNNIPK